MPLGFNLGQLLQFLTELQIKILQLDMEYTQKQEQINLDQTWEIFCHRHPQTHKPHKMLLELFNKLVFGQNKLTDMIFVKTFTLGF